MAPTLSERIESWQRRAFTVAAVAGAVLVLGALFDAQQFFRSYLLGYLYWLGFGLGSLAIVMLHHLTGGAWGFAIRRLLEAGARTIPLLAALFLPVVVGMGYLYPWSHAEVVEHDALIAHKAPYLNVPFFLIRAAIYFLVWSFLLYRIERHTSQHDRTGDPRFRRRLGRLGAIGLVVYVLTMTLAATDWAMSLEPHWFSTIYAAQMIMGQALGTFCLSVLVAARLSRYEPFSRWLTREHFHDLGNLMLAFVMLWAYMGFSQFLIIWSGNLPEETTYYAARTGEGWSAVALLLVLFHFVVPFLLLLSRKTKRRRQVLGRLALMLLAMRFVDLVWLVVPAFHPEGISLSWMDFAAPIAIGGVWMGFYLKMLRGRPLLSLHEAQLHHTLEEVAP